MTRPYTKWRTIKGAERAQIAELVRETYGSVCWLCHKPIPGPVPMPGGRFSVDHVIPDSLEGGHDIANLRPAHLACNSSRGNRPRKSVPLPRRRSWTED
jgi:5-methylcytosine-specific restriction endonuclease McrA